MDDISICDKFSAVTIKENIPSDVDLKVCKFNSLSNDEQLSLCIVPAELRNIFESLTTTTIESYIPRCYRRYLRDFMRLLVEDNAETRELIDDLSKSSAVLPYINVEKRRDICKYLLNWKHHLEKIGYEELNLFMLKNGLVNPKFDRFCRSKEYIKSCSIAKPFRQKEVEIEIRGDVGVEEKFIRDVEEFDPNFRDIDGLSFSFAVGDKKYVDLGTSDSKIPTFVADLAFPISSGITKSNSHGTMGAIA